MKDDKKHYLHTDVNGVHKARAMKNLEKHHLKMSQFVDIMLEKLSNTKKVNELVKYVRDL